ncbi:MAG: Do family serine endopeptidase [Caulobacterales bacterium]|jgi:serine protease Do
MSQSPAQKHSAGLMKRLIVSGSVAMVTLAGFAAAPALLTFPAQAQNRAAAPGGAPQSFADLIERISPSVVSIEVRQRPGARRPRNFEQGPGRDEDGAEPFGPDLPSDGPTALGSGFIIDSNGTIVTNHHVIADAEQITVRLKDGRELDARLLGSDEATDLAVLKVEGTGFPATRFAGRGSLRVGDWVIAVGNPFGLEGTVTAGIVSALDRRNAGNSAYVDFIQISAPINSGNSGGPTFDLSGNVVGVNSAIFSPTGGNVGIGFAIPADTASAVVQQLRDTGRVTRGYLGVQVQPLDQDIARGLGLTEAKGALVASVVADGPAASGGVRQGDVILKVDGRDIEDSRDLTQFVGGYAVGRTARLEIWREGQRRTLQVRLAERPAERELATNLDLPETPPENSAALGVEVRPATRAERDALGVTARDPGLLVTAVTAGSDLETQGVRPGDIILRANNVGVRTSQELGIVTELSRRQQRPVQLLITTQGGEMKLVFVEPVPQQE